MLKKGIIILVLFSGMALSTLGYCQNPAQKEKINRVTGIISDIDWVAGKFTVRTINESGNSDEITFIISGDTQITKGTSSIGFADINLTDSVTVEYSNDSFAGLKAIHITVKE
jgi:hypothetical protein